MFGSPYYPRHRARRDAHFHNHEGWNDWDARLSALTDDFYALDGGPAVYHLGGDMTIDGGPGIRHGMLGLRPPHEPASLLSRGSHELASATAIDAERRAR